jgi:hypothetical protein
VTVAAKDANVTRPDPAVVEFASKEGQNYELLPSGK